MTDQNMPGIASRIADLVLDGVALAGGALITYGTSLIYHPAGFICAGVFMVAGAWLVARKGS